MAPNSIAAAVIHSASRNGKNRGFSVFGAAVFALLATSISSLANTDDESLEYLLKKSSAVIEATISESSAVQWEIGVIDWSLGVRDVRLLAGGPIPPGIRVIATRFSKDQKDILPFLNVGERCIFFLRPQTGQKSFYATSDMWFGVQPYSQSMADRIQALAAAAR